MIVSLFNDVIGPVMRGPSSSHCAEAVRIGRLAGDLMDAGFSEVLVGRLIALGKRLDYFVYPNRDHGLAEGKGSLVHVRMMIARYLIDHLPAGPR